MAERPVVVVGGGLAGLAAALRLADAGRRVVLLEKRPRLGGAAFSFERDGLSVDNGQHVFLRCCTAYRGFVERVGARDDITLQPRLDIPVLRPDGRRARLTRTPGMPAPAHLGAALARYSVLSPADRLRAVRGALALRRLDPADRSLDERTLGDFLRRHGQTDAVIEALWGVVGTATLNLPPDDASLALAAKVFRTGLLDDAAAADVGHAAAPLGRLHHTRALAALHSAGVHVSTGAGVTSLEPRADAVTVSTADAAWDAAAVVLAVPPPAAFAAFPALARSTAAPAAGLGTTAIVNVHVVYDRQVTDLPFAAAVGSPVQWFFDRTGSSGLRDRDPRAQYLAVTVSAADALMDEPSGTLAARFVAALGELLPAARRAGVRDAFVTRQRHATFRQSSGTWMMRPSAGVSIDGVHLAGAWTDTGWPDTMEGAVRSGTTAADAVLAAAPTAAPAQAGAA